MLKYMQRRLYVFLLPFPVYTDKRINQQQKSHGVSSLSPTLFRFYLNRNDNNEYLNKKYDNPNFFSLCTMLPLRDSLLLL